MDANFVVLRLYVFCFCFAVVTTFTAVSGIASELVQQSEFHGDQNRPDWEETVHREEALSSSSRYVPEAKIRKNDPQADREDVKSAERAQREGKWLDDERYPEFKTPVIVYWPEGLLKSGPSQVLSTDIVVMIENRGPEPFLLETVLTLDLADQLVHYHELGTFQVNKGGITRIPISFPKDFAMDRMRYSGQLLVSVGSKDLPAPAISAPLFFHPTKDGSLLVYDEDALINQFGGGDFAGHHKYPSEPGTITTRVIHGGAGQVSYKRETIPEILGGKNDE